jgi:hypothetical protein
MKEIRRYIMGVDEGNRGSCKVHVLLVDGR